jgi:hypothetical protein
MSAAVTESGRPLQAAVTGSGRYRQPPQEASGGRYINIALGRPQHLVFIFICVIGRCPPAVAPRNYTAPQFNVPPLFSVFALRGVVP